ncbi:Uncharacterised protein [Burkholderia pseudomallei]|nr:Uncharacterised protein [Burkholderia pseudomallei]CAJ2879574.1 Uncharacterised protein [Burkholderia pseudomallei]CAJ2998090.1 Uncharacterised protein [Burkholderia pseudomallei]CAJ3072530.1 Uncharacterised protein [Burkholderia pseudomallei]CAJ3453114.1 Uncharacterised protein [Burkholderia pseudomallei]
MAHGRTAPYRLAAWPDSRRGRGGAAVRICWARGPWAKARRAPRQPAPTPL